LTIREPSTATTALRCTPPLPSRTVPARMVTGCCATASDVMQKSAPANRALVASADLAARAALANRVRIGLLLIGDFARWKGANSSPPNTYQHTTS
jgi:hypothetical protein